MMSKRKNEVEDVLLDCGSDRETETKKRKGKGFHRQEKWEGAKSSRRSIRSYASNFDGLPGPIV